jgi:hypothetical protein
MKRQPVLTLAASIALTASFAMASLTSEAQALRCESVISTIRPSGKAVKSSRLYPAGVDGKANPMGHMQIGYESEYLFEEVGTLLRDYAPDEIPAGKWLAMQDSERLVWLQTKFKEKPEFATSTGLKKIVDIDFMPDELIVDSTGNVEIVLKQMDSYQDWEAAVDIIIKRYGVGSQQAMISKPREAAFSTNAVIQEKLNKQHLGWLVYTNLKDMFVKLKSGFDRYRKDPTKQTALSIIHPFLGPMTNLKRRVMENFLRRNARGEKYDDESKQFVRKSDASFKYTGGPSYRPDIAGPVRFAWEIRNAHKDVVDLKMKVARDLVASISGLQPYAKFAEVPAFDSVKDFDKFSEDVRAMLKSLFPSKADPRFEYTQDELLSLQTYRNFSLPLEDFTVLAKDLTSNQEESAVLMQKLETAKVEYQNGIQQTAIDLASGAITADLARAKIMGLIGQFSVNSGLAEAFENEAKRLGHEGVVPVNSSSNTALPQKSKMGLAA